MTLSVVVPQLLDIIQSLNQGFSKLEAADALKTTLRYLPTDDKGFSDYVLGQFDVSEAFYYPKVGAQGQYEGKDSSNDEDQHKKNSDAICNLTPDFFFQ